MDTNAAFGKALRLVRNTRGMSQEDFSLVSSRTYLSTLERGLKSPTLDKIEVLAQSLGVHPLVLLTLTYLNTEHVDSIDVLFDKVKSDLNDINYD